MQRSAVQTVYRLKELKILASIISGIDVAGVAFTGREGATVYYPLAVPLHRLPLHMAPVVLHVDRNISLGLVALKRKKGDGLR